MTKAALDVDEVAVERFCAGDPPSRFAFVERRIAVGRLTERGLSAVEIAQLVGISTRQVQRDRAMLRAGADSDRRRGGGGGRQQRVPHGCTWPDCRHCKARVTRLEKARSRNV